MATEEVSLVPTGTAKYSPFNTFIATNNGWNYTNGSGHLVGDKTGLVTIFKFYGTALTFHFGSLVNGASYKVSVDGGSFTTFTGNAGSEAAGRIDVWATALSNGWHEIRIKDFSNNGGFCNWGNAIADMEGGFAGMGGLTATYTGSLPGGYSSAFYYADGWGPTSTLAQLSTDLGVSADVLQGNSIWPEYMKGVAFKGTGSTMSVRTQCSSGDVVLYSSTANGSVSPTAPCPYVATDIATSSTVDADGFIILTFATTNNVQYRLAIGVQVVSSINWSANARPSGTFVYADTTHGCTFWGDSTLAGGFSSGVENIARSTAVYYWVKSGAKTRGMSISGSLASALTATGAWASGLGSFNGLRLPIAAAADTSFIAFRGWINDTLNSNYGFSSAWDVSNTATSRTVTATTVSNDTASAINYIANVNSSIKMLFAKKYWSATSNTDYNNTLSPLSTAIAGRVTAGKLVTSVDCSGWDIGTNAVTIDQGIHPTPDEAGAGNDAEHWWQVVESIVNSVTVTSVAINQGSTKTVYGEATTTLTATVTVSAGTSTGVIWSVVSGVHTVNSSTGLVTAPGAGQSAKSSVIRATSNDDATKYANITVTTPAQTSSGGGSGGGNQMTLTGITKVALVTTNYALVASDGSTVVLQPENDDVEILTGSSAPAVSTPGKLLPEGKDSLVYTLSGVNLYARAKNVSSYIFVQAG